MRGNKLWWEGSKKERVQRLQGKGEALFYWMQTQDCKVSLPYKPHKAPTSSHFTSLMCLEPFSTDDIDADYIVTQEDSCSLISSILSSAIIHE